MADTLDPKYLDKRTLDRYVTLGALEEKALERHLKSLPDLQERCEPIRTVVGGVPDATDDE